MRCQAQVAQSPNPQSGAAIIVAMWFTVIVAGIVLTGSLYLESHRRQTRNSFIAKAQAVQIARSGLTEALSWMRRQTSQPVMGFAPQLDPSATPPILDTIDPDIGLVREFQITGKQWARYEVWKVWNADPDPTRLAWRQQMQCEDISSARLAAAAGSIWRLRSLGYVYTLEDPTKAFDEAPNSIIGRELLETEVQRLSINLPGEAAVNVGDGNSCHINTNGRIIGGTAGGIYYPAGSGTPTTGPASANRVTGTPALSTAVSYDDSFEAVFGVGIDDLRSMADMIVTDPSEFPSPVLNNALIIVDSTSTMQWDSAVPLLGSGIVIVLGNANLSSGSLSNFSGLLYIDGNFTMRDPAEIRGAVMCTGNMTIQGNPDYATILFDEDVLNNLRLDFGNYQRSNTLLIPFRRNE
ncbi:MAG: hypothetical protein H6838_04935 [Planctomycetes bacterium]|nr:hypothetical protein [Planctomycetota bacterium]MCB9884813.1 hypothetical protein [Planctomycetota bacterium]